MSCFFSSAAISLWFVFATLNDCGQRYWTKYINNNSSSNNGNNSNYNLALIYLRFHHHLLLMALLAMTFSSQPRDSVIAFISFAVLAMCTLKEANMVCVVRRDLLNCSAECFAPQHLIKLPISSLHRFITFLPLLKRQRLSLLHWCVKFSLPSMIWLFP